MMTRPRPPTVKNSTAARKNREPTEDRLDALWASLLNSGNRRASLLPERRAGARRRWGAARGRRGARCDGQRRRSPLVPWMLRANARRRVVAAVTGGGGKSPSEGHSTDRQVPAVGAAVFCCPGLSASAGWTPPLCHRRASKVRRDRRVASGSDSPERDAARVSRDVARHEPGEVVDDVAALAPSVEDRHG